MIALPFLPKPGEQKPGKWIEADLRTQDSMSERALGERGDLEAGRMRTPSVSPTRGDGGKESPDSNSANSSDSSSPSFS